MVKFIALSLFVTIFLLTIEVECFPLMNLYGYVRKTFNTHLYTYNTSVIGYAVRGRTGLRDYISEGIICLLDSDNSGKQLIYYNFYLYLLDLKGNLSIIMKKKGTNLKICTQPIQVKLLERTISIKELLGIAIPHKSHTLSLFIDTKRK